MRRCNGGPDGRGVLADQSGSLMIEAIAGIGLLAVVTAALAAVLPAVLDARESAIDLQHRLVAADHVLERERLGLPATVEDTDHSLEVLLRAPDPLACSGRAASRAFAVRSVDLRRPGSREIVLHGADAARPWMGTSDPAHPDLRVHLSGATGAHLVARLGDALLPLDMGVDGDCGTLRGAAPGRYEVGPADPSSALIGPTHLLLREHPTGMSVGHTTAAFDLEVAPAASVTVDLDPGGGRLPDQVSTGGLFWSVRGDDARRTTELSGSRAVTPGHVTVVVSACRNAETVASPARAIVEAGDVASVLVPLSTATLANIGARTGWNLHAWRTTDCLDGSSSRPELVWSGGLHDGMRIALPRGMWQLYLSTPGQPVSPRVLAPVGEPDLLVVMP